MAATNGWALCFVNPSSIVKARRRFLARAGEAADVDREELAAKLAAAQAEAQILRKELAKRKEVDLAKLKPAVPDKRVDGTGYRETLLSVPGEGEKPEEWGLTEAKLQEEEEVFEEDSQEKKEEDEGNENATVYRRLLIGVGLSVVAIGLAFFQFKPPPGLIKPPKPLVFYVLRILQLKQQLIDLEASTSDTKTVLAQLEQIYRSAGDWKDNCLSAAAWLDGDAADKASSLAYSIYDYLQQAQYNNYFDAIGQPSEAAQLEFVRFSLQSTKAARDLIQEFLSYVPTETLREAQMNQNALLQ
ncbi:hypothetical protein SELMODRAFT_442491 [Selaginella moellendorffii]|uniref:Uncharacterized protein n=1 Tax=Selaginella moellendorffii TaxID=88036 RepID=D8RTV1_SELML|nr:uncharacterized protein LOC9636446 isoform X1 [Selaginella moellendorffii]XP_024535039.1 uncharacterized protein LOC9636446 isoform X1 [Selaginella moellendorffii]XP_024535040.1 uncharacterized protein LOC9636446 isoform X1 [Selaginella moellendorffii]XP_024535041.1 uncharacterized protein LOC9636446 isoform X1 [Selaginella moellendorffii]XP_024535042.1 uncharacterized protein LOC9636446 isoform X1 [Selaginella moellendorffii]EFJ24576.1 hypothetical protein SELMODRAFT_442491 [Selaginella mo|eukprot:XP_002974354.1 uncharacterized protein LOC9636446 isoform X1 [Selaginella moellendorffii]